MAWMTRILEALCLLVVMSSMQAAPTPIISGTTTALMYLTKFGYMDPASTNPSSSALLSADSVEKSIMDFQAFAGLNQTGQLDSLTIEMMNTPRCGVKDKVGYGSEARKKRYALQGSRWRVRDLTYRITKYPKALLKGEVDRELAAAFKVWSDVTNLTFKPVTSGKTHIEIRFERAEHGDGDPFDGPGGTLAHAYFPIYGGDAHFDDTETWTIDSFKGTNLFQVAAHEFGHSLGLSHSDAQSALMAPFYRGYQRRFVLDSDDTIAIQSLYGEKDSKPTPSPPKPTSPSAGGALCDNGKIDAIVTMSDKETYVFKGSKYWKLTDNGVAKGYPKSITSDWGGLPSNIDAAFTWTNGKTYFFKGSNYWRFTDLIMDPDYPKAINKGFAGIPDNVDGAFVWSGNGKIYFFKGGNYWRFDPTQRPPVKTSYPKPVSNWEGLPDSIDDALQYSNGYTYFFSNGQYYRFNDRAFKVDTASPDFPRPVGYWWFGCPASGSQVAAGMQGDRGDIQPLNSGDVNEDNFDADGSNDEVDYNDLNLRIAASKSNGYQEAQESFSPELLVQPITIALSLLTTLLLRQ